MHQRPVGTVNPRDKEPNVPTIDQLLRACRDDVDRQAITWRRANWEKLWEVEPDLPGRDVLDAIDREVSGDGQGTIRRSWIRRLADDDPVTFLAASTIWGYGNYVRWGRPALRAMLRTPGFEAVTREVVDAARRDAGEGFGALFDDRGRARIKSLSIAFGTKVVHFAGYDHADLKPLVLDKRVYAGSCDLDDPVPVPNPRHYITSDQYRNYCVWAREAAECNGIEPELVEYVLFRYGGR